MRLTCTNVYQSLKEIENTLFEKSISYACSIVISFHYTVCHNFCLHPYYLCFRYCTICHLYIDLSPSLIRKIYISEPSIPFIILKIPSVQCHLQQTTFSLPKVCFSVQYSNALTLHKWYLCSKCNDLTSYLENMTYF